MFTDTLDSQEANDLRPPSHLADRSFQLTFRPLCIATPAFVFTCDASGHDDLDSLLMTPEQLEQLERERLDVATLEQRTLHSLRSLLLLLLERTVTSRRGSLGNAN